MDTIPLQAIHKMEGTGGTLNVILLLLLLLFYHNIMLFIWQLECICKEFGYI